MPSFSCKPGYYLSTGVYTLKPGAYWAGFEGASYGAQCVPYGADVVTGAESYQAPVAYPSPSVTTGGAGSTPPSQTGSGCGGCEDHGAEEVPAIGNAPAPVAVGAGVSLSTDLSKYPWWVFVLGLLILAAQVERR